MSEISYSSKSKLAGIQEKEPWGVLSYRNAQIGVHQHLEIKVLLALIANLQSRLQRIGGERNTVDQTELVWPCGAELIGQHRVRQAEIQFHGKIGLVAIPSGRFRRGLAQEFPVGVASEAMLW